jgi:2-haloacid dehalogenase
MPINTVIFDLGGVLIDWNPRYLYRKVFQDEARMEYFLEHICSSHWNEEQDGGRSLKVGTELLIAQHPDWENEIRLFYGRWTEMIGGVFKDTIQILSAIKNTGNYKLYALTNWSAETFPIAQQRYDFLNWFDGILVSGAEGVKKPDPRIYQLLLERFDINPTKAIFIDDNFRNVLAARYEGIPTIHFKSAQQLAHELELVGLTF